MSTSKPRRPLAAIRRLSLIRVVAALVVAAVLAVGGTAAADYLTRTQTAAAETWFAPYVDVTLTPHYAFEDTATNPVADVVLGFVVADHADGCAPTWGAAYTLEEASTGLDLDRRITRYRERGGDVIVSFGGEINDELALTCTDHDELVDAYRAVVDRYELTMIDLDIEGVALEDSESITRRARAIAELQQEAHDDGRPLHVWITVPVAASGLLPNATAVLDAMLDAGVDLDGINVMTMNFGDGRDEDDSMADVTETALRATHGQVSAAYRRADLRIDDTQVWAKLGATPMIGVNDVPEDIYELGDAEALLDLAVAEGLGRVSMWSANRDAPCISNIDVRRASNHCSGVEQLRHGFTAIWTTLAGRPNDHAERRTVPDTTPLAVDDPATAPYPIWEPDSVYEEGEQIVWRNNVYRAKWWTQGEEPDEPVANEWETPWNLVGPVLPTDRPATTTTVPEGTYSNWEPESVYEEGDRVMVAGIGYEAKWWTQGDEPGAGSTSRGEPSPWRQLR